ncbi:MAG: DUF3105 domain-containing protein [Dehalococcoidia bacterium]
MAEGKTPQRRGGPGRIARVRATVDSFGGLLTIGAIGATVLVVVYLIIQNPLASVSEDPVQGEERGVPAGVPVAAHTANVADMVGLPGEPPSIGPHFAQPWPVGSYEEQVPDGNVVHALEHGIVWFSYNPELISEDLLEVLRDVAGDFRRDVILSPRPQNDSAIYAVSWGRVLKIDGTAGSEEQLLRDFVETNRNRSPEPGVR